MNNTDNINIANVVIYARYSSAGQNDQSIDGQLAKCREYAEQRGFRVIHEYCDRALSGRHAETRPEFMRMIADGKKKAFKYILVWKLDRFARNRYDSAIYKSELRRHGVRVLSATEGVDEGSESLLLEAILEAMAEEYSRQLSQNVRRGMRQNAEKGLSCGGIPPFGYEVADKRYKINEDEARVVRYVHEQYAAGVSQKKILDGCQERGYFRRGGHPLNYESIKRILRNQKYAGTYVYGGDIILEDVYPAIVSKPLKEKVQARLVANAKAPGHGKADIEYLLHGKLFCGYCGAPMVGECGRSRSGTMHYYYTCSNRKKKHTCKKKNERKGFIEWYVVEQLATQILTPSRISELADAVVAEYAKSFDASGIKRLEKEIRDLDKELDSLVDSLIKATHPAAIAKINERIETVDAQRHAAEDDLASLRIACRAELKKEDVIAWLSQFTRGDLLDVEYQKKVIDVFINAIYLYDDRVVIFFNIQDCKQVSYIDMLDAADLEDLECSDLGLSASPRRSKLYIACSDFFLKVRARSCYGKKTILTY